MKAYSDHMTNNPVDESKNVFTLKKVKVMKLIFGSYSFIPSVLCGFLYFYGN